MNFPKNYHFGKRFASDLWRNEAEEPAYSSGIKGNGDKPEYGSCFRIGYDRRGLLPGTGGEKTPKKSLTGLGEAGTILLATDRPVCLDVKIPVSQRNFR
jgi:hypothetical protein